MATNPQENDDNNTDAEFDAEFKRLADARDGVTPRNEEPAPAPAPPEGNAPEDEPAPMAPAPSDDDGTSGTSTEAGVSPAKVEASDDRWKDVPAEVRAQIVAIEKERDEARHKAASDANRVAALSRKIASLTSADKAPEKVVEPTEAQKALDAKVTQLREDYPEVAEPVLELLAAQRAELSKVTTKLETVESDRQAQFIAQQQALLGSAHPDWQELVATTGFQEWMGAQPDGIQNLANSYDARETSTVLSLYKMEIGAASQANGQPAPTAEQAATEARRREQLNGGVAIKTRPAPVASGPPDDFEGAAAYFEAKKDREMEAARRR